MSLSPVPSNITLIDLNKFMSVEVAQYENCFKTTFHAVSLELPLMPSNTMLNGNRAHRDTFTSIVLGLGSCFS